MNLIIIQGLTDGTIARTLNNYETEDSALAAMYYELWSAVSNTALAGLTCVILSDEGVVVKRETWARAVELNDGNENS